MRTIITNGKGEAIQTLEDSGSELFVMLNNLYSHIDCFQIKQEENKILKFYSKTGLTNEVFDKIKELGKYYIIPVNDFDLRKSGFIFEIGFFEK